MTNTINSQYVIEDSQGPKFPWLQATEYRLRGAKDKVSICAPEEAIDLLTDEAKSLISPQAIEVNYTGEPQLAFNLPAVRWVILGRPSTRFAQDKTDQKIIPIYRGMKFAGQYKSVARVYLAAVVEDTLVLSADGTPQIWQMKLSGLKTQWIDGQAGKTMSMLNASLCKHYGIKRGWVTHLVSTSICAFPRLFKGASDESWGVMFGFCDGDSARPLSEDNQKALFDLVSGEDFKALLDDPFGLKAMEANEKSPGNDSGSIDGRELEDYEEADLDDIPF